MIQAFSIGPGARVACIGDSEQACVLISGGSSRISLTLHREAAARLALELAHVAPGGETKRPKPPEENWSALLRRLERAAPGDADKVRSLLMYLGMKVPR